MRAGLDRPTLSIEVYFDFVCPWCWIGRRNLTEALRRFQLDTPELATEIIWHGLQLLPETPAEGLPYQAFYERRLGSQAAVAARRRQVAEAGRMVGLEFRFEHIRTMPSTRLAHALVRHLQTPGDTRLVDTMIERLFAAYFIGGTDIGSAEDLCLIAANLGLDPAEMRRVLTAAGSHGEPAPDAGPAAISGVPYFVFEGGLATSGAQAPETLLALLQRSGASLTDLQGIA